MYIYRTCLFKDQEKIIFATRTLDHCVVCMFVGKERGEWTNTYSNYQADDNFVGKIACQRERQKFRMSKISRVGIKIRVGEDLSSDFSCVKPSLASSLPPGRASACRTPWRPIGYHLSCCRQRCVSLSPSLHCELPHGAIISDLHSFNKICWATVCSKWHPR